MAAAAVAATRVPLDAEFPAELREFLHLHGELPNGARGLDLVRKGPVDGAAFLGGVWAGGRGADSIGQVSAVWRGKHRARENYPSVDTSRRQPSLNNSPDKFLGQEKIFGRTFLDYSQEQVGKDQSQVLKSL